MNASLLLIVIISYDIQLFYIAITLYYFYLVVHEMILNIDNM